MPAPTAPLLDDFNRANAKPPSASYTLGPNVFTSGAELAIQSNVLGKDSVAGVSGENNVFYNAADFGADLEVVVTMSAVPTTLNDLVRIYYGLTSIGSGSTTGYALRIHHDGTGFRVWRLQRRDAGTFVQVGADQTQAVAAGDKIGVQRVGSAHRFYLYTGGVWSQVGTDYTDATYGTAGKIGVGIVGFGPIVDNLSVQTLSVVRTRPYIDVNIG